MKKIFLVLSVALLSLAGCTKFVEETIPADVAKKSGEASQVAAPSIELVAVEDPTFNTDTEFKVKVTPGKGDNYYSFAIVKGAIAGADAETILTQGYKGKSITVKVIIDEVETEIPLCGSFKASVQADTTVYAYDLTPNTDYTVYAVANNENGTLSEVTTLKVTTTDQEPPVPYTVSASGKKSWGIDGSKLEDGTIVITFDDPISFTDALKEGTKKFYATYLSANETYFDGSDDCFEEIFTAPIPVDSLSVSGKKVTIQVPERIPGAGVLISFDAGVVKNGVDLENPEINYGGYWYDGDKPTAYGLAARFKTKSWKFSLPMIEDENTGDLVRMPADTVIYFNNIMAMKLELVAQNLAEPIWQVDDEGEPISYNYVAEYKAPTIIYTDSKLRQVAYPAEDYYYGEMSDTLFVAFLSEEPDFGSSVALSVEAESVEDLWGNPCEAFSTISVDEDKNVTYGNYFYSYGYDLKDFYGTYKFAASSYSGGVADETVIIAPRQPFDDKDAEEYYSARNLAIYGLFANPAVNISGLPLTSFNTTHYATFSIHNGMCNVEYEAIGTVLDEYTVYAEANTSDGNYNFFYDPTAKVFVLQDAIYFVIGSDAYDIYNAGATLTKISDDYTIPNDDEGFEAGVAAKKAMKNTPKNFVIKR